MAEMSFVIQAMLKLRTIGIYPSVARLMSSQLELFDVTAADTISYLGVAILLGVVSAVACFIPACRATKVDPVDAIRHE